MSEAERGWPAAEGSEGTGSRTSSRRRLFELLEAGRDGDTPSRLLDVILITLILANVVAATLESLPGLGPRHVELFSWIEIISVGVFSLEYVMRIACAVEKPEPRFRHPVWGRLRYAASPLALIDLLAILPFYLAASTGLDLRIFRTLRLLKLAHYFRALGVLLDVIRTERAAFGAAYFVIALGIALASTGIYLCEHQNQPDAFGSIPAAIYWSIVTLTTVGYGDVVPLTAGGRVLGAVVMMLGVGMLAIPTGILATGFTLEIRRRREVAETLGSGAPCPHCGQTALGSGPEDSSYSDSL